MPTQVRNANAVSQVRRGAGPSALLDARRARNALPKLAEVTSPSVPRVAGGPTEPKRFPQSIPALTGWVANETAFDQQMAAWSQLDPNIAVGQLDREQVLTYAEAARAATEFADTMETAGRASKNPVMEDFAVRGALYFRAYALAMPLIWAGDHDTAEAGLAINRMVTAACQSTGI